MIATLATDRYAYYGSDEAEAVTWLEDPQQGVAKGFVVGLDAGDTVNILGDPVSSDKFAAIAGVGTIEGTFGSDTRVITAFWPVSLSWKSGKFWIPTFDTDTTVENMATEAGNGDSAADGNTQSTNQPGNGGGPGGTDGDGSKLNGNAGKQSIFSGLTNGDKLSLFVGLLGIAVAIYLAKRKG